MSFTFSQKKKFFPQMKILFLSFMYWSTLFFSSNIIWTLMSCVTSDIFHFCLWHIYVRRSLIQSGQKRSCPSAINPLPKSDVLHPWHPKHSECQFLPSKLMNFVPEIPVSYHTNRRMKDDFRIMNCDFQKSSNTITIPIFISKDRGENEKESSIDVRTKQFPAH